MRLELSHSPSVFHDAPVRLSGAAAKREDWSLDWDECRRILVIKLDHIGDWILCGPFLANLRRNAPRAEISAVVLPQVGELASTCPHVDRTVTLQNNNRETLEIAAKRSTDVEAFRRDYCGGSFDLVVVPRWDADFDGAARIAHESHARLVVGFSESCTRRKQVINRGDDRFYTHVVEDRTVAHEVEHNLHMLEALNASVTARHVDLKLCEGDEQAACGWLGPRLGSDPYPLIALAPFASEPKREMPIREFAELAHRIAAAFDCRFVIIGGPDDRLRGARLASLLRPGAVSAAGELRLRESAALIRHCDALVGVDSGPAHIAAAVGTSVAVLCCHPADGSPRHANSPARFAPWPARERSPIVVLQPDSATRPCKSCCSAPDSHCILGIDDHALARVVSFIRCSLEARCKRGSFTLQRDDTAPISRVPQVLATENAS